MEGLSPKKIQSLMSGARKKNPAQKGFALIRTESGLEKVSLRDLNNGVGSFDGKTGTPKRSRKGRTYPAPNGRRFYAPNWQDDVVLYCQ